jgi:hypothetical protein
MKFGNAVSMIGSRKMNTIFNNVIAMRNKRLNESRC